jgi:hypothetical protein
MRFQPGYPSWVMTSSRSSHEPRRVTDHYEDQSASNHGHVDEHHGSLLSSVIPFRQDKYTHQMEVRTSADIEFVAALGWFEE